MAPEELRNHPGYDATFTFTPPKVMEGMPPVGPDEDDTASQGVMTSTLPPRSTIQMTAKYLTAVGRWIAAGFPKRSDEEVERIYDLCSACKWMHEAGYCQKCGCRLSKSRQAMTNKIRMATEHCPLPEPKW